ncbi:hypothetical protein ACIQWZ_39240 [Streptomyces sp. NPDC098077]|uniref:hypothetical protein n=1 Tax=Streptomyces sp. NPDC098077 TaxID=3366093 RepID=UPI003803D3AB
MANLVYKRVSTDQQSAGIEDPVVFNEDPDTSSRLHPLQRPKFRELLTYARLFGSPPLARRAPRARLPGSVRARLTSARAESTASPDTASTR